MADSHTISQFARLLVDLGHEFRAEAVQERAEAEARAFTFPAPDLLRDSTSLNRLGTVEAVISEIQDSAKMSGFNINRVRDHYSSDPHFDTLCEIALHGAIIDTDPSFLHVSQQDVHRPLVDKYPHAFSLHAHRLWSKGKAVIFQLSSLPLPILKQLSFCGVHLAFKPDDDLARFCIDPTNAPVGVLPLNSPAAKEASIQRYGKIHNPSIHDIYLDWIAYKNKHRHNWCQLYIYKEDVKSAFPQFSMSPSSALLLAAVMITGYVTILISGSFGWTGAPMVYAVIGCAMLRALHKIIQGPLHVYCDDFIGLGTFLSALSDQMLVIQQIINTFGPAENSWNASKSSFGQDLPILGWQTNLAINAVRPSDRGIRKLIHAFFDFHISDSLPLTKWQELASLAQRYAEGLLGLNNFIAPLNHMCSKCNNPRGRAKANSSARFVIEIWRSVAIRLWQDCFAFRVSIEQFARYDMNNFSPRVVVSDSSTPRVAAGYYHRSPSNTLQLLAWSAFDFPFVYSPGIHDATNFQTQREYLGLLLSLILSHIFIMVNDEHRDQPLTWVNDNTGALTWADNHRCSSASAQSTAMAVSWFQIQSNTHLHYVEQIAGTAMGDIDAESRRHEGHCSPSLTLDKYIHLQGILDANGLFHCCDPTSTRPTSKDHHHAFKSLHSRLSALLHTLSSTFPVRRVGTLVVPTCLEPHPT